LTQKQEHLVGHKDINNTVNTNICTFQINTSNKKEIVDPVNILTVD